MQNNIDWFHPTSILPCGIIVGCDERQEWILPWWWNHYSVHNTLPVLFVDFGLSSEAAQWCEQKGKVVSLPFDFLSIKTRDKIEKSTIDRWEAAYGNGFWRARTSWFKKPFALLQTHFEKTLWLDIDCEVRDDLSHLFYETDDEIALAPEPEYAQQHMQAFSIREKEEKIYNSGVVLYRHGSPLVLNWAKESLLRSDSFWSDQHLLSRMILEKQKKIHELSQLYNWHMALGKNEHARIVHWLGDPGKEYICLNLHGFL
jgi:hypothetical protein